MRHNGIQTGLLPDDIIVILGEGQYAMLILAILRKNEKLTFVNPFNKDGAEIDSVAIWGGEESLFQYVGNFCNLELKYTDCPQFSSKKCFRVVESEK